MTVCEDGSPRLGRLLLVEDDEPTLELLSLFLGRLYPVTACSDGEGAIQSLCADGNITVIVTDLHMPGVNGFDVLRCAAAHRQRTGRAIPAIVLTGHGTPEDEEQARSLGVTHFQRKPIDLRRLQEAIKTCRNASVAPDLAHASAG